MSGGSARSLGWLGGLVLAGLAGNALHLSLLPGVSFFFGSIAVLLVVRLYGPVPGTLAALVAGSYTYLTWGSPVTPLFFVAEALAVGLILRHRPTLDLLVADGIFWLFAGIPAGWLLYPRLLPVDFRQTALLVLAAGVSGVFNALVASAAAHYLPLAQWAGRGPRRGPPSLYQTLFHLLVGFVLVPALALTLVNDWRMQRQIEADVSAQVYGRQNEITRVLRAWEDEHLHAVVQLAQAATGLGLRPSERLQQTTELIRLGFPDVNNMYVAGADGTSVSHSPLADAAGRPTLGTNFADQPYFGPLKDGQRPYVTDAFLGRVSRVPVVGLGVPLTAAGRFDGYAFASLSLNRMTDLLRSFTLGGLRITLVGRDDRVIASTRTDLSPLAPYDRRRGGETTARGNGYEWRPGDSDLPLALRWERALYGVEGPVSADIPWHLVVEAPMAPYRAQLQDSAIDSLVLMILLCVLVLALAVALSRWLADPLSRLAAVTTNLPGRLLARDDVQWPAAPVAELSSLVDNFQSMAGTLREHFALLQRENVQQRSLLAAALEATDAAVLIADAQRRTVYANRRFYSDFGYSPADVLGQAPLPLAPGATDPETAQRLAVAFDAGQHLSTDAALRRRDGTAVDVEAILSPINGEDGQPSHYVCVLRDISARKAVERMKSEFVSTASHELRTPLTALRGALGLLTQKPEQLDPRTLRLLTIAGSNTDRLIRMVGDILDLERIESGRLELDVQSVAVDAVVEQSVQGVRALAEQAGIALVSEVAPALVRADPDKLVQVLINLLGNAIKFSEAGTTVLVSAERQGEMLRLTVRDQGRGIPPEQVERIFDRFIQVDASDARARGGSGLGLAIARAIVEQLGGRIWVESEVGRGSTFYFTLKLAD